MGAYRLENVKRAQRVYLKIGARIHDGGGDGHLPRQMQNGIGGGGLHGGRQCGKVAHIAPHHG